MTSEFTWRQSSDSQYEVLDGDTVVATLTRHGASGTRATGETPRGSVALRRTGAFRTRVTVTNSDDVEIASVAKDGKSEAVQVAEGGSFVWAAQADPKGSRAFVGANGAPVLTFTPAGGDSKAHGTVVIADSTLSEPETDALMVLGLFLLAIKQSDDDATIIGSLAAVIAVT